jgi:hypothetical protein
VAFAVADGAFLLALKHFSNPWDLKGDNVIPTL